jgi:hypothetical protein
MDLLEPSFAALSCPMLGMSMTAIVHGRGGGSYCPTLARSVSVEGCPRFYSLGRIPEDSLPGGRVLPWSVSWSARLKRPNRLVLNKPYFSAADVEYLICFINFAQQLLILSFRYFGHAWRILIGGFLKRGILLAKARLRSANVAQAYCSMHQALLSGRLLLSSSFTQLIPSGICSSLKSCRWKWTSEVKVVTPVSLTMHFCLSSKQGFQKLVLIGNILFCEIHISHIFQWA